MLVWIFVEIFGKFFFHNDDLDYTKYVDKQLLKIQNKLFSLTYSESCFFHNFSSDSSLDVRLNIYLWMFSVLFICHKYLCLDRLSYRVKEAKSKYSINTFPRFSNSSTSNIGGGNCFHAAQGHRHVQEGCLHPERGPSKPMNLNID